MARIGPKRLYVGPVSQGELKKLNTYDTIAEEATKTIEKGFNKYIEWVQPDVLADTSRFVKRPINPSPASVMQEFLGVAGKTNKSFQWPEIAEQIESVAAKKAGEEFGFRKGRVTERFIEDNSKHALKRTAGVERLVSKETIERRSKRRTPWSPVISKTSRTQIQQPFGTSFASCSSMDASRRNFQTESTPVVGNSSHTKASIASKRGDNLSSKTGVNLKMLKPLSLASFLRFQNKSPLGDARERARGTWPNLGESALTSPFTPNCASSRPPGTAATQAMRRPTPCAIVPSTLNCRRFDYGLPCQSGGGGGAGGEALLSRGRKARSAGRSARGRAAAGAARRGVAAVALHVPAKRWAVGPRPPGSSQRRPPPHPHMSCDDARYLRRSLLVYGNCL